MDARELILNQLHRFCQHESWLAERAGFTWDDRVFLRTAVVRLEHGDASAWTDFITRLAKQDAFASCVRSRLELWGYLYEDFWSDRLLLSLFPPETEKLNDEDAEALLKAMRNAYEKKESPDELPSPDRDRPSAIMYIEYKGGSLIGPGRIGRVTFSKSRKTIYYQSCKFQSLKGYGYKANYRDVANGGWYWISNCRADGQDTLYPDVIEIDDDVRQQYWTTIRNRPDLIGVRSFRSEGKFSKRRPQPETVHHPASGPR